jgi:hypothetical protein
VTYFALGDTTTRIRAGAEARVSTSKNTSILIDFRVHRSYRDTWLESGLRLQLHF